MFSWQTISNKNDWVMSILKSLLSSTPADTFQSGPMKTLVSPNQSANKNLTAESEDIDFIYKHYLYIRHSCLNLILTPKTHESILKFTSKKTLMNLF